MFGELWSTLAGQLPLSIQKYRNQLPSLHVTEKPDRTLLTKADLEVEALIVKAIRAADPGAQIIAEESGNLSEVAQTPEQVWVIDPIDGTAEFVRPDRREFCSVICLLERGEPVTTLVVAPELGHDRTPLIVFADRAAHVLTVNGQPCQSGRNPNRPRWASVTRSSGSAPHPFEPLMAGAGFDLKTSTTSQTIDMLRTSVDLTDMTDLPMPQFDLFYRKDQKIWDGVAGLCLGAATGLTSVDNTGSSRTPVEREILSHKTPSFDSTIMGLPEAVEWFLEISKS
ncbi:inositol monophosphatase family protein [Micromonospora sp. LOL_023]|uniref:inositol monophosphatase family protein n=1 Tax=Micromonospora sp. LOL_023 TaxID=3345418 RepID=UPI003A88A737